MPIGSADIETRLLADIQAEEIAELARALIRYPSVNPPGDEEPLATFLAGRLRDEGLRVDLLHHEAGRASLAARLAGTGERPGLILTGHLDVVGPGERPWSRDPFGGEVVEGHLHGRGATDMKGAVAAMAVAASALRRSGAPLRGDLVLAFTAGEETNSLGAEALAGAGLLEGADAIVVGEPTDLGVYVAEKGNVWLRIETRGRAAHASTPEVGRNAIYAMAEVVAALERFRFDEPPHPLLGAPTLSVGLIRGGVQPNVVPDGCAVEVDVRTLPGQAQERVRAELRRVVEGVRSRRPGLETEVQILAGRDAVSTPADSAIVREVLGAVETVTVRRPEPGAAPFATDASVLVPALGIPMAICGPGRIEMAHQTDEHVAIEALVQAARVYALVALRHLS